MFESFLSYTMSDLFAIPLFLVIQCQMVRSHQFDVSAVYDLFNFRLRKLKFVLLLALFHLAN